MLLEVGTQACTQDGNTISNPEPMFSTTGFLKSSWVSTSGNMRQGSEYHYWKAHG